MSHSPVRSVPLLQWKHNRFDAYKQNTTDTAIRNLPPDILRAGWHQHHVRVNLEQGKAGRKPNWKRPKEVFFNSRRDPGNAEATLVEKVSRPCGT